MFQGPRYTGRPPRRSTGFGPGKRVEAFHSPQEHLAAGQSTGQRAGRRAGGAAGHRGSRLGAQWRRHFEQRSAARPLRLAEPARGNRLPQRDVAARHVHRTGGIGRISPGIHQSFARWRRATAAARRVAAGRQPPQSQSIQPAPLGRRTGIQFRRGRELDRRFLWLQQLVR